MKPQTTHELAKLLQAGSDHVVLVADGDGRMRPVHVTARKALPLPDGTYCGSGDFPDRCLSCKFPVPIGQSCRRCGAQHVPPEAVWVIQLGPTR